MYVFYVLICLLINVTLYVVVLPDPTTGESYEPFAHSPRAGGCVRSTASCRDPEAHREQGRGRESPRLGQGDRCRDSSGFHYGDHRADHDTARVIVQCPGQEADRQCLGKHQSGVGCWYQHRDRRCDRWPPDLALQAVRKG